MSSNGVRNEPTVRALETTPQVDQVDTQTPVVAPVTTEVPAATNDAFVGPERPPRAAPAERPNPTAAEQGLRNRGPVYGASGHGRLEPGRSQMVEVLAEDKSVADVLTRVYGHRPQEGFIRMVERMNPPLPSGELPPRLALPTSEHMLDRLHGSDERRTALRADANLYDVVVPGAGQTWRDVVLEKLPGAEQLPEPVLEQLIDMLRTANPGRRGAEGPPPVVALPKGEALGKMVRNARAAVAERRSRPETTTREQFDAVRRVGGDLNRVSTVPTAGSTFDLQTNSVPRDVILQAYRARIQEKGLTGQAADDELARVMFAIMAANSLPPNQLELPDKLYLPSNEQLDAILGNFTERDSTGTDGFDRLSALADRARQGQPLTNDEKALIITWAKVNAWAEGTDGRIQRMEQALANGADPTTLSAIDVDANLAALEAYAQQLGQIEAARNPMVIGIPGLFGFDLSKFVAAAKIYNATHGEELRREGESAIDFALRTSTLATPEELTLLRLELEAAQQRLGNRDETVFNFLASATVDTKYGSVDPSGRVTLRLEVDGKRLTPDQAINGLFGGAKVPYDLRQLLLGAAQKAGEQTSITVDPMVAMLQGEAAKQPAGYQSTGIKPQELKNFDYDRIRRREFAPIDIETALPLDTPVEDIAKHLTQTAERSIRLDRFNAEQRAEVRKQISDFAIAIDGYRQDARTFHDKIMLTGQYLIQRLQAGETSGGPLPSFLAPRQ